MQYTLEPLVYVGPAEGMPKDEWKLRSAKELLDLKICDMACGSGAFLGPGVPVHGGAAAEAWDAVQQAHPGTVRITPEGEPSTGQPGEMPDLPTIPTSGRPTPCVIWPSGACTAWTRTRWRRRWRSCRCGC